MDGDELLRRYQPVVWFDSHEAFFAHDVRAMAERCPDFRLERADGTDVIATHQDGLNLETLALVDGRYPNGMAYEAGDHFGLHLDGPDQFATLAGDYRAMERALPAAVRDKLFGRTVTDGGVTWLQYWFFYLYNDAQFAGRFDMHEGDWEMVQLRLGDDGTPVTAVYAQHAYAEARPWENLEFEGDRPIVYSGRGSHASYFEAGLHRTYVKHGDGFLPLWWDAADGRGRHVDEELLGLTDGWAQWRGAWGGTHAGDFPLNGDSPGGPITHGQWGHPTALEQAARDHPRQDLAAAPAIEVRRAESGLAVAFDLAGHDDTDRMLITATAEGEPPITETIVVDTLEHGIVFTRTPLTPNLTYQVITSTISTAGIPTAPGPPTELGPVAADRAPRLLRPLLRGIDDVFTWLAEHDERHRG